ESSLPTEYSPVYPWGGRVAVFPLPVPRGEGQGEGQNSDDGSRLLPVQGQNPVAHLPAVDPLQKAHAEQRVRQIFLNDAGYVVDRKLAEAHLAQLDQSGAGVAVGRIHRA